MILIRRTPELTHRRTKTMNNPNVTDSPATPNGGSLKQPGSTANPALRRWRVRQGKWQWKPTSLYGALATAKRQLWGATEPVVIEPVVVSPKWERKRRRGEV